MIIDSPKSTGNFVTEARELDSIAGGLRAEGPELWHAQARLTYLIHENPSLFAEILDRAHFDQMTRLHNRSTFKGIVDAALGSPESAKNKRLVMLDWINFKTSINDPLGQSKGDQFLSIGGSGLMKALWYGRAKRVVSEDLSPRSDEQQGDGTLLTNFGGRVGGDEMAVLLHGRNVRDISKHRVLDIALQTLIYPPLLDWLSRENAANVGIRVATTMLDPNRHKSFEDVERDADPKLHTLGAYSLIKDGNGVLIPVEGYIPQPRKTE